MKSPEVEPEKGEQESETPRGGYPRVSKLMANVPDVAVFHTFPELSTLNLLYYQADLCELKNSLEGMQAEDRTSEAGTKRNKYEFDFKILRDSAKPDSEDGPTKLQWKTVLKIRKTIKEYQKALLLHREIVNFHKPSKGQFETLREWMKESNRGNTYFVGEDADLWDLSEVDEFVSMKKPSGYADISSDFTTAIIDIYHNLLGRYIHKIPKGNEDHLRDSIIYRNEGVIRAIRILQAFIACMLPIVGILALYLVKERGGKDSKVVSVGLLAAFTAAFSLTLCFFSKAEVKDIFSATAAFSAVLVVFLGTN